MRKYGHYYPWTRTWSQGALLDTPDTRRWTEEEKAITDREEQKMIFRNFSYADHGKSRKFIMKCENAEEAFNRCVGHNALVDFVSRLDRMLSKYYPN